MGISTNGNLLILAGLIVAISALFEERSIAVLNIVEERSFDGQPDKDSLPKEINITAFGEVFNLKLVKNSPIFSTDLTEDIITTDNNGNVFAKPADNNRHSHQDIDEHFFTDESGQSSLHVEKIDGKLHLEGILNDGIRIKPSDSGENGEPIHIAYKHESENGTFHNCVAIHPNYKVSIEDNNNIIETRSLPAIIQPELLLLLDYKISSYFKFDLNIIKKYLGVFFNSVNRRYASFSSPNIRILISGIFLTPNEDAQTFVQKVSPSMADSSGTLDQFGKWIFTKRAAINRQFDMAYWLTALNLGSSTDSQDEGSTQGISYVGGVCMADSFQNLNVAIGRDDPGQLTGVHTAAHEIGHLLGAAHDGSTVNNPSGNPGARTCPWADGYIMSYIFGTSNKFYFSSCSIKEFQFTIQNPQASCLWRTSSPLTEVVSSTVLPGELVSLDKQCQTAHGQDTFYYAQMSASVCVERWCAKKTLTGFTLYSKGPAYEGSPCDNGNVCIYGKCSPKRK